MGVYKLREGAGARSGEHPYKFRKEAERSVDRPIKPKRDDTLEFGGRASVRKQEQFD
jgi:hypothetical protein